ncbi:MAG: amidohydrolase family protein [Cyclobacteriaceae bacterium]|nr:amidohydrolase family protein [Cyclobacteriaceae bacterium]
MNRLTLLLFGFLALTSCREKVEVSNALYIEHINIIDPDRGLIEDQTVIIKDGRIIKVVASKEFAVAGNNNQVVSGEGKFLIPGLWDAHIHFAYMEEVAPRMFDLFLTHGITSVRDTGGKIDFVMEWRDKSLALPTEAPRVMIAGPLLDGIPNVYDGSDPGHPPLSVGLNSTAAVRNQIIKLDSLNVDFLKAYEMLTPEQFSVVTEMGKQLGLKVTGHVPLSMDVISASNAGLNSMEHMRNLELSCASNAEELFNQRKQLLESGRKLQGGILRSSIHQAQRQIAVKNYDENKANEVLDVLAKNQTWQIPTLALNTLSGKRPYALPEWQADFQYFPDTTEARWKSIIDGIVKTPPSSYDSMYTAWMFAMVKRIHDKGIDMMAGTDSPIGFQMPGPGLHNELAVFVEAGLTPLEALRTATVNPARYFNLEQQLGSIREDMWADLVILDANPLDNIANTRRINAVIKQGRLFDREELNRRLEALKN